MSSFLLDTHVFLWWLNDDPRLSPLAREVFAEPANELLLSVASCWEMAIKFRLGKLRMPGSPRAYISEQMQMCGIRPLPLLMDHVLAVSELELHHGDPFDRVLIAQAQIEGLTIITADEDFRRYDVQVSW